MNWIGQFLALTFKGMKAEPIACQGIINQICADYLSKACQTLKTEHAHATIFILRALRDRVASSISKKGIRGPFCFTRSLSSGFPPDPHQNKLIYNIFLSFVTSFLRVQQIVRTRFCQDLLRDSGGDKHQTHKEMAYSV